MSLKTRMLLGCLKKLVHIRQLLQGQVLKKILILPWAWLRISGFFFHVCFIARLAVLFSLRAGSWIFRLISVAILLFIIILIRVTVNFKRSPRKKVIINIGKAQLCENLKVWAMQAYPARTPPTERQVMWTRILNKSIKLRWVTHSGFVHKLTPIIHKKHRNVVTPFHPYLQSL